MTSIKNGGKNKNKNKKMGSIFSILPGPVIFYKSTGTSMIAFTKGLHVMLCYVTCILFGDTCSVGG